MAELLQFVFSGLTVGATYALVALGFAIIYNASGVINFAQGEFVMAGGMSASFLVAAGVPLPLAVAVAVAAGVAIGLLLEKFAIEPARRAPVVTLIIITIGASIAIRGVAQLLFGKQFHTVPPFTGEQPIAVAGATILPQSLWVMGASVAVVIGLSAFFGRTKLGKAMLAAANNRNAAQLVGINVRFILLLSFGLSALLGAVAGVLISPITLTSFDVGIMVGLKGFAAAMLGGLGSGVGAIAGGLLLGLAEALGAGYLSSAYKDVIAFVIILAVLVFMPGGLFGKASAERV
ncbi:MAG: branched-chain amino acid ABC transporter permease [Alphaproteobacteria bacterium]